MLGRLKVRARIHAGFATVIVLGLAVAGYDVWQVANVDTQVRGWT